MDEKELVRRIRNSLKAKKTRAQITSNLQKKGYKLAYIDKMIEKAVLPKKVVLFSIIIIFILFLTSLLVYVYAEKDFSIYENPLNGFNIVELPDNETQITQEKSITKEQITINENFINFLLKSIGVSMLHKHPLTFENPIINILIDNQTFSSIVDKEIITTKGMEENADLQITTTEETILEIMISKDPEESILESFSEGGLSIKLLASEAELFAKGYFSLYQKFGL